MFYFVFIFESPFLWSKKSYASAFISNFVLGTSCQDPVHFICYLLRFPIAECNSSESHPYVPALKKFSVCPVQETSSKNTPEFLANTSESSLLLSQASSIPLSGPLRQFPFFEPATGIPFPPPVNLLRVSPSLGDMVLFRVLRNPFLNTLETWYA